MKKIKYAMVIMGLISLLPFTAIASEPFEMDRVAVSLVLDNSGSMRNSDPTNNRFAASKVILNLLTESDYLNIIAFSDEAVNTFPMSQLDGSKNHLAETSLDLMPLPAGYTDYTAALSLAESNLDAITDPGVRKFIIFLTDGKPEVRDTIIEPVLYLGQMIQKSKEIGVKGYPIHTVGFGDSDKQILNDISLNSRGQSLVGDSTTVALSFFEILRELKNRYILIDQSSEGEQEYQFSVDQYTSRLAVVIQAKSGADSIKLMRNDGIEVKPVVTNDNLRLFNLNSETNDRVYTLMGEWNGQVKAVRDTKTKLWIMDPAQNEQIPFEEKVTATISQTGTQGENAQLEVLLKKGGNRVSVPVEISSGEGQHTITIGQLPQTGIYELEASLRSQNQLIAKTSSTFELKNIPSLYSSILESSPTWIHGDRQKVMASLRRNETSVISNLNDVEITLQIIQNGVTKTFLLQDDGEADSGDIIKGDGIYTIWVKPEMTGSANYSLTAQGKYIGEDFLIGGESKSIEIAPPGEFLVSATDAVQSSEGNVRAQIQLTNQGSYSDSVSVLRNGETIAQSILVDPGETEIQTINWVEEVGEKGIELEFRPTRSATKMDHDRITIQLTEEKTSPISTPLIAAFGGVFLLLIASIVIIRRRPAKVKIQILKGEIAYSVIGSDDFKLIHLTGKSMFEVDINRLNGAGEQYIIDKANDFRFTVFPIDSVEDAKVIEVRCVPPTIMKIDGKIATTAILSPGDRFEMEGYQFEYLKGSIPQSTGNNVLEGRL